MRTGKSVTYGLTSSDTKYVYEGGLLLQMNRNNYVYDFSYDANGTPIGFKYTAPNGVANQYYYGTNSRGDVVAVYHGTGSKLATYSYDAYGKPLAPAYASASPSTSTQLLVLYNPLRYRGYVYDHETGFYYLQSRYYDPTTCRFINGDSQLNTDSFTGYNMFAYCSNNPIVSYDPTGTREPVGGGPISTETAEERRLSCERQWKLSLRDVTEEVNAALIPAASSFALLNISTFTNFTSKRIIYEARDLCIFGMSVYHESTWDIKRKDPWEKTIKTSYPGEKALVIYEGIPMTPAQLGNYTYGYLGRCAGYPLDLLYLGSYCAAECPSGSKLEHEILEDWPYINLGFNFTKK